jgi:hypothetical protein
MPRGGARVNSGPPPDPNALRRDRKKDQDGWTSLPAEGWKGKIPAWPLPADVRASSELAVAERAREMLEAQIEAAIAAKGALARLAKLDQRIAELEAILAGAADLEASLWKDLWRTPQAAAWHRVRWTREVALYVRWQVRAELGDIEAAKEARQWSDRLGLNPTAMLRNRWRVVDDEVASKRAVTTTTTPSGGSMRDRLKAVAGGGS